MKLQHHRWPYHTWFFNWLEQTNTKFGNWLWAKRWRNFKK